MGSPYLYLIAFAVGAPILVVYAARSTAKNTYDDMASARWAPTGPAPEHQPLIPVVDALVDEGYVVDSYSRLPAQPRSMPAAALVHPDGSVAVVMQRRGLSGLGPVRLAVETGIPPAGRELCTMSGGTLAVVLPGVLLEVASRRLDVGATVLRHRAGRVLLQEHGVLVASIALGQAGPAIEAGDALGFDEAPQAVAPPEGTTVTGGGVYRTPLAERAGIGDLLAEIRAEQMTTGG